MNEINLGFMNGWGNIMPKEWEDHCNNCDPKDAQRYLVTDNGNHEFWRCTKCNIKWEIDMS